MQVSVWRTAMVSAVVPGQGWLWRVSRHTHRSAEDSESQGTLAWPVVEQRQSSSRCAADGPVLLLLGDRQPSLEVGIWSRGCLNVWDGLTCDLAPLLIKAVLPNFPPSFSYQLFLSMSFLAGWNLYASNIFNQPVTASPKTLLLIWAESPESSAQTVFPSSTTERHYKCLLHAQVFSNFFHPAKDLTSCLLPNMADRSHGEFLIISLPLSLEKVIGMCFICFWLKQANK